MAKGRQESVQVRSERGGPVQVVGGTGFGRDEVWKQVLVAGANAKTAGLVDGVLEIGGAVDRRGSGEGR